MKLVEADDGVKLWVERTGGGKGIPLVLCHGGPGLWDNLGPLAALLDHHRPVIRWDQRGCGRSEGEDGPFTVKQFVDDLEAVRRSLDVPRWIVGGHSWGAALALTAVLAHPRSAAGLLYVSGTGLGRGWHASYKAASAARLTAEQRARCETLERLDGRSPEEEVEWRTIRFSTDFADRQRALELAAIDARAPFSFNRTCNAVINAETKMWDESRLLKTCTQIAVPALLLHGAEDPRPPSAIAELGQAIPNSSVTVLDDAGHSPWLERPGAVATCVQTWLTGLGWTRHPLRFSRLTFLPATGRVAPKLESE